MLTAWRSGKESTAVSWGDCRLRLGEGERFRNRKLDVVVVVEEGSTAGDDDRKVVSERLRWEISLSGAEVPGPEVEVPRPEVEVPRPEAEVPGPKLEVPWAP